MDPEPFEIERLTADTRRRIRPDNWIWGATMPDDEYRGCVEVLMGEKSAEPA